MGFNTDEQTHLLAQALASRLGYSDVSNMLRSILQEKISETFTDKEREQILGLLSPKSRAEPQAKKKAAQS